MSDILALMDHVLQLKQIVRSGWEVRGIWDAESVADHSYATTILALALAREEGLDQGIVMRIALVHDLAESITGDIVTEVAGVVNMQERAFKDEGERDAFKEILGKDPELYDLALSYIEQSTREARLVKEADKLELAMQAVKYESKAEPEELDEFFVTARKHVVTKTGKALLAEIEGKRKKRELF